MTSLSSSRAPSLSPISSYALARSSLVATSCHFGSEVDVDARGGRVLARLVERDVGRGSLRLAGATEIEIERRRGGCRGGRSRRGRFTATGTRVQAVLRVDRAAERRGFFPFGPGAV